MTIRRSLMVFALALLAPALLLAGATKEAPKASGAKTLKAGFVYVGPVGDYGWTNAHDVGRKYALSKLPWLKTVFVESVPEADSARIIDRLVQEEKCDLVLTTSFGYMDDTVKAGAKYSEHAVPPLLGLQERQERRHVLRRALPDVLPERAHGRCPHQERQGRLRRRLPDPRGRAAHRRLRPRRQGDEPEGRKSRCAGSSPGTIPRRPRKPPRRSSPTASMRWPSPRTPPRSSRSARSTPRRASRSTPSATTAPMQQFGPGLGRVRPARGLGRHVREDLPGHPRRQVQQRRTSGGWPRKRPRCSAAA